MTGLPLWKTRGGLQAPQFGLVLADPATGVGRLPGFCPGCTCGTTPRGWSIAPGGGVQLVLLGCGEGAAWIGSAGALPPAALATGAAEAAKPAEARDATI